MQSSVAKKLQASGSTKVSESEIPTPVRALELPSTPSAQLIKFGAFAEDNNFLIRAERARNMLTSPQDLRNIPFQEAAKSWLEYKSLNGNSGRARYVSQRSVSDLKQYIGALERAFSGVTLESIHIGHIREFQLNRANGMLGPEGRPQREVGPNKINQEVGTLIRIMKHAQCWTPQLAELYMPLQREESDIPRALSPSEQEHWIRVAASNADWHFVWWYSLLGLDCPMSTNEERGLRLGDLDLSNNLIMVRVKTSKNKYRTRSIPMSDEARWALDRILARAADAGSTSPLHYLMPFRRKHVWVPDKGMTVSGIKRAWDSVRKAAGLEWFTPYGLRHTSITRYAEAGTPIAVIMSLAGHMSRRMQEHYTHISEQVKRKAVQNIARQNRGSEAWRVSC